MNSDNILRQVDSILNGAGSRDEKLETICKLLDREIEVFNWTGFYLVAEDEEQMLELGPYVGEATDHTRISFGTGICGQVAETLDTFVVQDVHKADYSLHLFNSALPPKKFLGEKCGLTRIALRGENMNPSFRGVKMSLVRNPGYWKSD